MFGKAFKLTKLSFAQLEEALDFEAVNLKNPSNGVQISEYLQNLYKEILIRLGKVSDKSELVYI